ncbi:hypothetical protein GUJ93_ZPchr0001g32894 [Zizania palustris]|uniref:Uncharacterized protein n=1 Tax=Zizania palustris TaxID=103762 RepID=A0A8J5VLN4_ZIZPA|nr:hypothetical protein GUJ93_ZPchr0001g32894 [Zizania palustris]
MDGATYHDHWNPLAEQVAIPVAQMGVGGLDSNNQQRGPLPSVYGNGSGSRSRIPSVPPMAPQFMRPHGNINEQYQQSSSSLYTASQRSGGMTTMGAAGPATLSADSTAFSLFHKLHLVLMQWRRRMLEATSSMPGRGIVSPPIHWCL